MPHFNCRCCGNCCRWEGVVYANEDEMPAIADYLGISVPELIDKYTRLAEDRSGLVFEERKGGACVFLTEDNLCSINPVKPAQCRNFPYEWKVPEHVMAKCQGEWVEDAAPANESIALVHVLGHPNLPLDIQATPEDAQVFNCHNFCNMLAHLGIPFIYYGVPGSKVPHGGVFASTGKPIERWAYGNAWHKLYNERLNRNLKHCVIPGEERAQLICSMYGAAQSGIVNQNLPVIEPMVGYDHCWAQFRVFPSYAQQNVIYSKMPEATWETRFHDTVIPHFLNPLDYHLALKPSRDYLLYMGRDTIGKGVEIARNCAKTAGVKLYSAFGGVSGYQKAELLANARAVIMPTIYVEPFGYVAVEAQMCGTPVITTDWGAFVETVIPGVTGFRCRTEKDFVEAISKCDTLDRAEIRKLAIERFAMENVAPKYERYFIDVWNFCKCR